MFCLISINVFGFGSSVVVQMAQFGDDNLIDTTILLEDGILDILFDSGYIVTNFPVSTNKDYKVLEKEMIFDARAGYMNDIVYIGVKYYNSKSDTIITVADIESVQVKIINSKTKSVLFDGIIDGEQKGQYETDITAVKHFANSIGLEIKKQLGKI